MCALIC